MLFLCQFSVAIFGLKQFGCAMDSNTILDSIVELIQIKRRDIRQSQLTLIASLINGSKEKKELVNQIVTKLCPSLMNTDQKYVRHNCAELLTLIIYGLGTCLE